MRAAATLTVVLAAASAVLVVTGLHGSSATRRAAAAKAPGVASAGHVAPDAPSDVLAPEEQTLVLLPEAGAGSDRQELGKQSQRLLAQGIVTDEAGNAVPNATVRVELQQQGGAARWRPQPELQVTSALDGSFRVEGPSEPLRIALSAQHPRYSSTLRTECEAGDAGIVLRLRSAGSIAGSLELEHSLSVAHFVVRASGVEDTARYEGVLAGDGTYEITGLPAGSYDLVLSLEYEPGTAIGIDDVFVTSGSVTRLGPIDLVGRVTTFRLSIRDADGTPPANAFVQRRASGAEEFDGRLQPVRSGEALIATLDPCVDLWIGSPDHRAQVLACVSDDREVVLGPALKVHLVLDEGLPSRREEFRLGVSLERQGTTSATHGRLSSFDERGMAEAEVGEPGSYDVRVYAWRRGENGVSALLSNQVETRIEVPPDVGEPVFSLRLSPETLSRIEADEHAAN